MKAPIAGVGGSIWSLVSSPRRVLAPLASLASRALGAEFWVDTEEELSGDGPRIKMSNQSDIQHPRDGAGPLNHRRYQVRISDSALTPTELITEFRCNPNDFSPTSFAVFDPPPGPKGMVVGDEVTVRLPGPWDGPVVVTEVKPRTVVLETRPGHMEAGWIRFTAVQDQSEVVFEIESLARSGDRAFDLLYHPAKVGKMVQTEMWIRVLEAAVKLSRGRIQGRPTVRTTIYLGADQ